MIFIKEISNQIIKPFGSGCDKFNCSKNQTSEGANFSRTKNKIQSCCPSK